VREAAGFDLDQVILRAAQRGVAMEINSQPQRIDLNDSNARLARSRGVALTISTDAHSTAELDYMRYGVFTARRAGLTKADVLNTLPLDRFRERRRGPAASPAKPPATRTAAARPKASSTKTPRKR
jgi:DNA polymerase (family 10)